MVIKDPHPLPKLTPQQIKTISEQYNEEAEQRKTEFIQIRVTPRIKAEIKRAAQAHGHTKYQQWVNTVLYQAVANTFPERYSDPGDDF